MIKINDRQLYIEFLLNLSAQKILSKKECLNLSNNYNFFFFQYLLGFKREFRGSK